MIAGCAQELQYDHNNVINAESFLHRADQTFLAAMKQRSVNLSDNARCYFAVADGDEQIQGSVYCGAARSYVGKPDQVWWKVNFTPKDRGNEVRLTEPTLADSDPTTRPDQADLLRPDGGHPPVKSARLAAPTADPAEPGMIIADGEALDISRPERPEDRGVLRGPTYQIEVTKAGRAAAVIRPGGPVAPAPGEVLFAAKLSLTKGITPPDRDVKDSKLDNRSQKTTYTLVTGERRKDVTKALTDRDEVVVAVSASRDATPRLQVAVDGGTQTLSLTNGERVVAGDQPDEGGQPDEGRQTPEASPKDTSAADTLGAAYYRDDVTADLDKKYRQQQTASDFEFTYSIRYARATLTPYSAKFGWAPAGKAWLMVSYQKATLREETGQPHRSVPSPEQSYALRTTRSEQHSSPDASPSPGESASPETTDSADDTTDESADAGEVTLTLRGDVGDMGNGDGVLVFEAPDSFTAGELVVSPAFSFTAPRGTASATVTMPTKTYAVRVAE